MDKKPVCRRPTADRIRDKAAANDNVAVHWRADWLAVYQLVLQNVCQQSELLPENWTVTEATI